MRTLLFTSMIFITMFSWSALATMNHAAKPYLSKAEVKEQAVDICRAETERRYGAGAIKYIAEKSAWSKLRFKSMKGAMVSMKIKPEGKRPQNYHCFVRADKRVQYMIR